MSKQLRWLYRGKCFGYTKSKDGKLVICPKEAAVVKLIFDLYMEGNSILAITRILEEKGIPTPTEKRNGQIRRL